MNNLNFKDMKTKFFIATCCFLIAIGAYAQKGIDTGTPYGQGEDSVRCAINLNLFVPAARANNFAEAYPFWKAAYDECPASHINIYILGVNIINWQISQETDPAKKEELINDMMKLYDDRIKYFGNDPRLRKDGIVARKSLTYNELKSEATDHQLVYKWLGDVIDEFKEKTDPLAIARYMFHSFKLMMNDMDNLKEQYIKDFLKCSDILETQLDEATTADKTEEVEKVLALKTEMEQNFYGSGAADCDILKDIYASKVEENKDNLDFLKETMLLLRRMRCNETDLFITASEYAYKIEPTADAAMGLGLKATKDRDFATAEKYYNEAISMSNSSEVKADLYFTLSVMANQQNQHQKAKQFSMKCLGERPNYAKAYLQLAQSYALGARNIYPDDAVLSKCIYYAIVDKLERARQLDPSLADEANRQINTYSKYFPTKEEVFMHPSLEAGGNFTIGSWVNETVKIR